MLTVKANDVYVLVAFRGAIDFELQIGPAWIKVSRPRYWRMRGRRPVIVGWDSGWKH